MLGPCFKKESLFAELQNCIIFESFVEFKLYIHTLNSLNSGFIY